MYIVYCVQAKPTKTVTNDLKTRNLQNHVKKMLTWDNRIIYITVKHDIAHHTQYSGFKWSQSVSGGSGVVNE